MKTFVFSIAFAVISSVALATTTVDFCNDSCGTGTTKSLCSKCGCGGGGGR